MSYLRNQPYDEKDFPAFAAIREQLGFCPISSSHKPRARTWLRLKSAMTGNLILKEGALPRRQKEYIFLVCSAANLSTYCVTAHCEMVRMLKLEGPEPEQIAIDYVHCQDFDRRQGSSEFLLQAQQPDYPKSDRAISRPSVPMDSATQQILEAILLVGWAKFANTVAFGLGTVPDFENRRIAEELGKARAENREEPLPAVG